MIHYSCDRCRASIDAREDIRYVLKIEVQLAAGNRPDEMLGDASVEELEQLLEQIGHPTSDDSVDAKDKTFDLCSKCYSKYIANPLALDSMSVDFSKN